ncbi:MAG: J domain-containing protein [Myxococcales bacterium]|nr:J domain-containing protein [Myxococcales bacterium]
MVETIDIKLKSWDEVRAFFERDLQATSMSLPMAQPPPVGTPMWLRVVAPDGASVPLPVTVTAHRAEPRPFAQLRVVPLDDACEKRLARFLLHVAGQVPTPEPEPEPPRYEPLPPPPSALKAAPEEVARVEAELGERLARYRGRDGYSILGLRSEDGEAEVEAAYARLVKAFHPHHFARYGSPRIRQLATEIFVQIRRAHRESKAIVDARALKQGEPEGGPRVQRHAGRNIEQRAISEALQFLGLHQYDAAAEVLDRALASAPKSKALRVQRHLVDARRARQREDHALATRAYGAIRQLDPSHQEAIAELERLEALGDRQAESGGAVGKLRRWMKGVMD